MRSKGFFRAAMICAAVVALAGPARAQSQAQGKEKPAPHIDYVEIVSSSFSGGEAVKRGKFREKFFNRTLLRTDVKVGTTVTWTNRDDIPHTVVCAGKFRSKALDTDGTFSFTFTEPGEYKYFCSLHPHMTGTIKVG